MSSNLYKPRAQNRSLEEIATKFLWIAMKMPAHLKLTSPIPPLKLQKLNYEIK